MCVITSCNLLIKVCVFCFISVCRGTNQGLDHQGDAQQRFDRLKRMYTNCTFIDGNLEILFLDEEDTVYDLSFLKDIKEVTGYVLFMAVFAEYIPLTSLRIIRGRTLYEHNNASYSLYIALNYQKGSRNIGLQELRFISLHGECSILQVMHMSI